MTLNGVMALKPWLHVQFIVAEVLKITVQLF